MEVGAYSEELDLTSWRGCERKRRVDVSAMSAAVMRSLRFDLYAVAATRFGRRDSKAISRQSSKLRVVDW